MQVDISCDSVVLGDTTNDAMVGPDEYEGFAHPWNMLPWSAQQREHFGLKVDDGKGGQTLVNAVSPRYLRMEVTKSGNFTFEACQAE